MFHWPARTVHLTRKMEAHYCIMVHNKRSSTQYRTNSIRKLRLPHNRLFYPFVASRWYLSIFVFLFLCPLYPHFLANRHTTRTSSYPPSFYCRRLCYRNLRFAAYSLFRFSVWRTIDPFPSPFLSRSSRVLSQWLTFSHLTFVFFTGLASRP